MFKSKSIKSIALVGPALFGVLVLTTIGMLLIPTPSGTPFIDTLTAVGLVLAVGSGMISLMAGVCYRTKGPNSLAGWWSALAGSSHYGDIVIAAVMAYQATVLLPMGIVILCS